MSTNDKLADAPITHDEAAEAVESMDDCAKMDVSVDPFGARATLERYIAQQRAASLAAPVQADGDCGCYTETIVVIAPGTVEEKVFQRLKEKDQRQGTMLDLLKDLFHD